MEGGGGGFILAWGVEECIEYLSRRRRKRRRRGCDEGGGSIGYPVGLI